MASATAHGVYNRDRGRADAVGREIHFVFVRRVDHQPAVIGRPLVQNAVVALDLPVLAGVVRPPEHAAVDRTSRLTLRAPTPGLHHGIDDVGVTLRDGHAHLADRRVGQAVTRQTSPAVTAVGRLPDAAVRSATIPIPGTDNEWPRAGIEDPRIVEIHGDLEHARVLVDEQDLLPCLAAVLGPVDAPLLLRSVAVPHGRDEHDIGVPGIDRHATDAPRFLEPMCSQVRPASVDL